MGNLIKQTRGTEEEHQNYTGEKGVISLVTNEVFEPTGEIRVHDGKTPGGINPIEAGIAAVSSVTSDMFVGMIASFGMETPKINIPFFITKARACKSINLLFFIFLETNLNSSLSLPKFQ